MKNIKIIQTLKQDISELQELKYKYNFTKGSFKGVYSICLNAFINNGSNCFNKSYREIQFKTNSGANKFIELLNNDLKANLRGFLE